MLPATVFTCFSWKDGSCGESGGGVGGFRKCVVIVEHDKTKLLRVRALTPADTEPRCGGILVIPSKADKKKFLTALTFTSCFRLHFIDNTHNE